MGSAWGRGSCGHRRAASCSPRRDQLLGLAVASPAVVARMKCVCGVPEPRVFDGRLGAFGDVILEWSEAEQASRDHRVVFWIGWWSKLKKGRSAGLETRPPSIRSSPLADVAEERGDV